MTKIDATDKEMMQMAVANNKVLRRAEKEYNYLTGEEAERRMEELREKWEMDRVSAISYAENRGVEKGIAKGIAKGEKRRSIEIAKNMLNANMKIDIISKITGLTKEEIKKLK